MHNNTKLYQQQMKIKLQNWTKQLNGQQPKWTKIVNWADIAEWKHVLEDKIVNETKNAWEEYYET